MTIYAQEILLVYILRNSHIMLKIKF